jgi:AP-2 complex subunit beta-1
MWREHVAEISTADLGDRCFLFLVNYARVKPEIALKALPTLVDVG